MQAVSLDEEHARLMLAAMEGKEQEPYAPPMATWSPEAGLLATLVDEIRGMKHILVAVNSKQKPSPPPVYPRPRTALEKVRLREREAKHRSLVARMLPHKTK